LTHAAKVRDEQKSFCDCNWFMNKEQPWESLLPLPAEDDDQQKGPLNGNGSIQQSQDKRFEADTLSGEKHWREMGEYYA
jgi:hypothetical protein